MEPHDAAQAGRKPRRFRGRSFRAGRPRRDDRHQQRLDGASDDRLFEVCRAEERCLITLDLDFANPLRFALAGTAGVCVLRYAPTAVQQSMLAAINTLAAALQRHDVAGQLWIVTPDRIRAYAGSSDEQN
ncbi:MAG: DUF5615 family PIN-like protein [Alphaproteobacteria bacterium]|nr:DUF5615 family PIN-like protein [Alphaproteobacteria bacterium]